METQKIVNLLNSSENEYSNFATKKWRVIDSESKGVYSHENQIKFLTSLLESSPCDYSDAYVLVTGNIAVVGANNNTKLHSKIVHHSENVEKKPMRLLLILQNILILQCLCTI